jgi:hypothetical protein
MPTAKKAPAKKAAARRTAVPKLSPFDAARKKIVEKRESQTVFDWEGFERTWQVCRPNPMVVHQLSTGEATFTDFVLAHFVEDQRADLVAVTMADPTFDFDIIELMIAEIETLVYADLPLGPSSDS